MKMNRKIKEFVLLAMFSAIILILGIPGNPIGFVPLPLVRGTTIHIPVIIGSLMLGPKYGAFLGFMFGLVSFTNNTFNPTITSFVFSPFYNLPGQDSGNWLSLVVTFVPRILVVIIPWFVYVGLKKLLPKKFNVVNWAAAGVVGSMTNTLLVMHLIFIFFGETWWSTRERTRLLAEATAEAVSNAVTQVGESIEGGFYAIAQTISDALATGIGATEELNEKVLASIQYAVEGVIEAAGLVPEVTVDVGDVASNVIYSAITGIIMANGVPEAVLAGIVVAAIMGALTVVARDRKV